MSDYTGKAVQASVLNLDHYQYEEISAKVDEIVDRNSTLCDTYETLCGVLTESFRSHYYYYYAHDMMKV